MLGTQTQFSSSDETPSMGQGGDSTQKPHGKPENLNSELEVGRLSLKMAQGGRHGSNKERRFIHKYDCHCACMHLLDLYFKNLEILAQKKT